MFQKVCVSIVKMQDSWDGCPASSFFVVKDHLITDPLFKIICFSLAKMQDSWNGCLASLFFESTMEIVKNQRPESSSAIGIFDGKEYPPKLSLNGLNSRFKT